MAALTATLKSSVATYVLVPSKRIPYPAISGDNWAVPRLAIQALSL
jgi:hypothetical protein